MARVSPSRTDMGMGVGWGGTEWLVIVLATVI